MTLFLALIIGGAASMAFVVGVALGLVWAYWRMDRPASRALKEIEDRLKAWADYRTSLDDTMPGARG